MDWICVCVREFVIVDRLFSTVWMNVEPLFSFNLLLFSEIHATHLQTYIYTYFTDTVFFFHSVFGLSKKKKKVCVCVYLYKLKYQDTKGSTPNYNPLFATPAHFIPSLFTFYIFVHSDKYRSKHLLLVYFSFCQNLLSFPRMWWWWKWRIRNFENIYSRAARTHTHSLTKTQWKSAQNVSILLWFSLLIHILCMTCVLVGNLNFPTLF